MAVINKKRFIPPIPTEFETNENFEQLLNQTIKTSIKEGTVVKGKIVRIEKDIVVVDVQLKNEGRIPLNEFRSEQPQIDDMIDVYVEKIEGRNGRTILSREKAVREESWIILENAHKENKYVDGVIFDRIKGGFTVDLSGVVAFLPGSQVDVRPIKDMSPLMDIVQPFQILSMDKKLGNIVVSRRAILEESRSEARDEMLAQVSEGVILEGVVKNILNYGVFVDLGSIDGLLHITDISWKRINHPSEVLSLGQRIRVVVTKFNEETKRISLGMKQLDANPWDGIENEIAIGQILHGKVTNIPEYGVLIEIKPGVEGLVHTTEISWTKNNQYPRKLLSIGQEVEYKIIDIDLEKPRVSLSIKQCMENPWKKFADGNQVGKVMKAVIRNITDFGLFVGLSDDIDGLIHESDLSWTENGSELLKNYSKGDEIEFKILSIDVEKERVTLGIKQLTANPNEGSLSSFNKNDVVDCKITAVGDDSIEVEISPSLSASIKKNELANHRDDQNTSKFKIGETVKAKIIGMDKATNKINLSIKAFENDEHKRVMKEYSSNESAASLGDKFGEVFNKNN